MRYGGNLEGPRPSRTTFIAVKLLDHYSQFRRTFHTCEACGWSGPGGWMDSGPFTCLGVDKFCPACGEFYAFAKFSVIVGDDDPDDWPPIDAER